MTRILVLGDTHGDTKFLEDACRWAVREGCDRIFQVGDWGFLWPGRKEDRLKAATNVLKQFDMKMWFIDGNHEWFDKLEELGADAEAEGPVALSENITYMPRGYRWEWDGVSFLSLGGAFSIDQESRVPYTSYWPRETIRYADVDRAIEGGEVNVMFTHDAPEGIEPLMSFLHQTADVWRNRYGAKWSYKLDPGSRANRKMVSAVVEAVTPVILIHGHYHWRYEGHYNATSTHVVGLDCNGSGRDSWVVLDTEHLL